MRIIQYEREMPNIDDNNEQSTHMMSNDKSFGINVILFA